jgi:hypothetical protein
MNNHPNRSKSAALRYVVYSVASHNALSAGSNTLEALDGAADHLVSDRVMDTEFVVVFTTRSRDALDRFDAGRWPSDAEIVFRGSNELAQRYRSK